MKYYIFIFNNKIMGKGQCECITEGFINVEVDEDVYNNIDHYIWDGEAIILNPNYDAEQLEQAKQVKYVEALQKAYEYQQNGTVEHKNCIFEMSDSNRKNLSDTEEALKLQGIEETTWLDKDDNYVTLTVDDIQYIRLNLILATIQQLWIFKYPYYKELISLAETVEEVNAIEIDYTEDIPEPEPEPEPIEQEGESPSEIIENEEE